MSYPTNDGGGSPSYVTTPSISPSPIPPSPPHSPVSPVSSIYDGPPSTTSPSSSSSTTSQISTSTTTTPWITSSKEVMTSTPVAVISVSSSNGVARTYTSTSYSSYRTEIATTVPSHPSNSSTNVGAIVGGVVGGVAFIAIIGIVAFILIKRRRKRRNVKEVYDDPSTSKGYNSHPFNNDDLNSYGSPTLASDNVSQGGRAVGAAAIVSGAKPRPFVQPYNPGYDDQQSKQYAGYSGSQSSPPQSEQRQQYYEDYQGYQPSYSNYNSGGYAQQDPTGQYSQQMHQQDPTSQYPQQMHQQDPTGQYQQQMQDTRQYAQQQQRDGYYTHQPEPLTTVATSTSGTSSNGGRYVPDEVDNYAAAGNRGLTRHIPDEA